LDFVDGQLGAIVAELDHNGLAQSTAIILSAKHGQSPTEPGALTRIDDAALVAGLNAAWTATHPGAAPLVAHATNDDAMLMWLSDRSPRAAEFVKDYLLTQNGVGTDITGKPRPFTAAGLQTLYTGADAARYFHAAPHDPAVPDVYGIVAPGVVYTAGTSKIAEHGGAAAEDRQVALVINSPSVTGGRVVSDAVQTTQIAPTILHMLNLDPNDLKAVQMQHTAGLPGLDPR
jgi:arylsulfatase A-like enzyme